MTDGSTGPLRGIRIIDVSTILAGPMACQILGDFGADVIKIEHPVKGDGLRGHGPSKDGVPLWWKEVGRNKRSAAVNIGDPRGADILRRLVSDADVLVENFRPGTLERWGLDPVALLEDNPRLVVARITGFGQTGPYAQRAGFGTLAEAMSGFAHLTGFPQMPPTLPAFGLADSICAVAASSAITMALYHRDARGGRGQIIDLSILEPILAAAGPGPTYYDQLGVIEQRLGNRSAQNAPRNIYSTSDGRWVAISTSALNIAERVLRLVGHPEVITEPWFATGHGRAEHGDELDGYVGEWIAQRTRDEVITAFSEAGAAIAPVYDSAEVSADPQVQALGMVTRVDDPDLGSIAMHNVMWRMSETPGSIRHAGRSLGADTSAVLHQLGFTVEAVEELRRDGIVA
jgi:crotonobetainyl-CoA:carnitine CoA-transferase CaiB-like acyl-CoA transferase